MKESVPELRGDNEDEDDMDGVQSHNTDESELDFSEDENDLVSDVDGDDPTGLVECPSGSSDAEDEQDGEWQGFGSERKTPKRKRELDSDHGEKRRKLRALPTFASYEDYATMIENSKEEDI